MKGPMWVGATLDHVVEIVRGISFPAGAKAKAPFERSIACLRTTNVQREVEWENLWFVSTSFVKRADQFVREGDILISNANSLELVGKVALVRTMPMPATLGAFITLLRTRDGNDGRFVYLQLASPEMQSAIRALASTTTNISNVSTSKLAQIALRLPPLLEQKRIVSDVERQFTRLDAGVASLRRVQANLKRYRAAVLKTACEGRLVPIEAELARKEGRTFETGEALVVGILNERRRNLDGRGRYKEPAAPNTASLPILPHGWTWSTFGQLCRVQGGFAFKSTDYVGVGVPLVRISNLVAGRVQLSEGTVFLPPSYVEANAAFVLRKGDVLIAMSGATTGKMATMDEDIPALLNQRVGRFVLSSAGRSNAKYISFLVMQISDRALKEAYGAAQPNISSTEIEAMPVAVPPLAEQGRIVAEVERRLSVVEELEAVVSANLKRARRLRQSVLRAIFLPRLRERPQSGLTSLHNRIIDDGGF